MMETACLSATYLHPSPLFPHLVPSGRLVLTFLRYLLLYRMLIYFFFARTETSVTHSPHVRPRVQTAPGHLRCRLHQTQRASSTQAETAAANHGSSEAQEKMHEEKGGTAWLFFPPLSFSFSRSCNCNWRDGHRSNQEEKTTQQNTATVSNKKSCCFFFSLPGSSTPTWLHFLPVFVLSSALL